MKDLRAKTKSDVNPQSYKHISSDSIFIQAESVVISLIIRYTLVNIKHERSVDMLYLIG